MEIPKHIKVLAAVRMKDSGKSQEEIEKIFAETGELFLSIPEDEDWVKVVYMNVKTGAILFRIVRPKKNQKDEELERLIEQTMASDTFLEES